MKGPGLPMSRDRLRARGKGIVHRIVPARARSMINTRHNQLKEIVTALTGISKEEIDRTDTIIAELIGEEQEKPLVRDEPPYFDPVSKWPSDEQDNE